MITISCPIFTISDTISDTYRGIPVSCQCLTCHLGYHEILIRYRRFFRYRIRYHARYTCLPVSCHLRYRVFADIFSDMYPILQINLVIYGYRRQKHTTSIPKWNQYRNIPISTLLRYRGQKHDIGVDILPAAPQPPAGRTGHRH